MLSPQFDFSLAQRRAGLVAVEYESYAAKKPLAGMHGYAPEDPHSPAFFGSSEAMAQTPAGLCDLYSLFCEGLA